MDDRYSKMEMETDQEENRTVRTTNGKEKEGAFSDAGEEERRKKEKFENDRTVRYSDWTPKPQRKENVTVRLSDAGFDISQPKKFSSSMIDPVAVVLSDDNHTQMPSRSRNIRESTVSVFKPVGWLLCVEGAEYGKCFSLKSGVNTIGRSDEMDVVLKKDLAVSRSRHAQIEYLDEKRCFLVSAGDQRKIVYINDELLLEPTAMKKNDLLMLGDSSLMLIPCCDESFSWSEWDRKE